MKRGFLAIILALTILFCLSACGGTQNEAGTDSLPSEETKTVSTGESKSDINEKAETYSEITELFSGIIPDAEIKVTLRNGKTLHTKIRTQLASEAAPDGWDEMLAAFGEALASADEKAADYSASAASAEILAADETILSSGYNASVRFNKFEVKSADTAKNPPTISKFEYDQISVGMTLSQVREIVGGDGRLENAIGTAGVTSTIQTYRFPGEKDGSYADILFDDYQVYSKFQFSLD